MAEPGSKLVGVLLDRLYATLVNGPLMSCRPHSSRQRLDLFQLAKLKGPEPHEMLKALLGPSRTVKLLAPVDAGGNADELRGMVAKLRTIIEDAKTYEEDTGTQALFVGFPLLNLPPQANAGPLRATKRILAPLAFVPLRITIKATRPAGVILEAVGDGADLVVPNAALLAWVERLTGKDLSELFADDEGADPWRELNEVVTAVTRALELREPPVLSPETSFVATPRSNEEDALQAGVISSAVVGLFPAANQGLLRDLQALSDGAPAVGPIESFLKAGTDLGLHRETGVHQIPDTATSLAGSERCVSQVDPCQARAVHLARKVNGLVIHGPPGTGKSQTITNIIGDHLAAGERVLFVCDKRTAIDVVAYRLEHLGLGALCAVVHDALRDRSNLYKAIREQLDALVVTGSHLGSVAELRQVDAELARIHGELTEHENALSARPSHGEPSFHELTGMWFALRPPRPLADSIDLAGVSLHALLPLETTVREVMERGLKEQYAQNPWVGALQADLGTFLGSSHQLWEARLQRLVAAAQRVDELGIDAAPPFAAAGNVREEGQARRQLGELVQQALLVAPPQALSCWLMTDPPTAHSAAAELETVGPCVELLASPPDRELALAAGAGPSGAELVPWIGRLASYLQIVQKWYSFFLFGRRRAARQILERFGLALDENGARRVTKFLERLRARRIVEAVILRLTRAASEGASEPALLETIKQHLAIFRVVRALDGSRALAHCTTQLRSTLSDPAMQSRCIDGLRAAEARSNAIGDLEAALGDVQLLSEAAQRTIGGAARRGETTIERTAALLRTLSTVEGLLRIETLLATVPPKLGALLRQQLAQGATPDGTWHLVKGLTVHAEIQRRLQTQPALLTTDGDRVQASHQRYRALSARRRELARDLALHVWVSRQRERLLASTGSRLNPVGAEIRRRLVTRGERALRVRQMIGAGAAIEGGDPLFDLRPVWMASPDVVAQIFPREAMFDVVIFDEASQCRLEEGLPVLLRAKRVVIAGDPQQLPPTRFFESAVAQNVEQETEDEQGLFEAQQGGIEDLLGAALNLSVEQAYLDVHYRSTNSDLIEFSNRNFYESRLQAIPAHPSSRAVHPPLRLVSVNGVYDKRRVNAKEAQEVVKIVKQLLSDPSPPSIGIACFNLAQRDEIVETLDRAAGEDADFGARLAAARIRQGQASFEGLFVRNLESVQGDERDHMIISTTYGPDPQGRFYRRFGPLGQAGGGRRLNVLVTRARSMVHLVTSIPRAAYQSQPPVPAGVNPNGAWLLFDYLAYAERLAETYAENRRRAVAAQGQVEATSTVATTLYPSGLAVAIGDHLKEPHEISTWIHWGNDGFAVDVAVVHPERPDDVTIGILCDGSRFLKAADRVQWDMFRHEVLESQKWRLLRLWSPQIFRDPDGAMATVKKMMHDWLAEEAAIKRAAEELRSSAPQLLN